MSVKNNFKRNFNLILTGTLILLIILGASILFIITSLSNNARNSQKINETLSNVSNCQSAIGSFLQNAWADTSFAKTGTNSEMEAFNIKADRFEENVQELKKTLTGKDLELLKETVKDFQAIRTNFNSIGELVKESGFKDIGIEGKMRDAAHKLEHSDLIKDKTCILNLRKHEKDFLLRKDLQYLDKFENESEKLNGIISSLHESEEKMELQTASTSYLSLFRRIVELEKEIGLNKTLGLRGSINISTQLAEKKLTDLLQNFEKKNQDLIVAITCFIILVFGAIILVVVLALNKLIKPVFKPMGEIQMKISEISQGNLSVNFDQLRDNKILKELIEGFEKIIVKFKTTMEQMEGISSRKNLTEIPLNSDNDEVSIGLNKILNRIVEIDKGEKSRIWHNEGLAKFANLLRNHNQNIISFYDEIISELVKYLNANQGALFLIEGTEENDEHLSLKACYAYSRKKFLNKRIELGEGLAGTCWIEGERIFLNDVPKDYVRITSGLGEALPTSIIIIPIKFNDKMLGVLEIASFYNMEEYQIAFTETIADNIGSTVHNLKTNEKTIKLLQTSQEMTEEMRAQEEEMRQNMEELQATQEEMERMSISLKNELRQLSNENQELKLKLTQHGIPYNSLSV